MKITPETANGRKTWKLNNDAVTLTVMEGGGHISGLNLNSRPSINPLWKPAWKTMEPWHYKQKHAARYGVRLLAAICGHNLCFAHFGESSPEEVKAGLSSHGEAPVLRWKTEKRSVSGRGLNFVYGCTLPVAEMSLSRRINMPRGSHVIHVTETIHNHARRDVPFGMCQHVTFGPPFLEPEVTIFDVSATRGHTFPGEFGSPQRMKPDTSFVWPDGPGANGKTIDLRTLRRRPNSDFSTQMLNPALEHAWFSAVNPAQKLLVAYVWKRSDFPWLGNWEENYARPTAPWNKRTLTRGMEFSTSPFPVGLRTAVSMNNFHGQPTFSWLPARGKLSITYAIIIMQLESGCKGVSNIVPQEKASYQVELIQ